jgi:glyoxylase-like metal-dependent hydrolase (beta-lactamase superfamily II)
MIATLALTLALVAPIQGQDVSKVEVKVEPLGPGLSMLTGAGGNLAVSSGPDGVLVVDDDYAPLTDKIKAAIAKLGDKPIRFVVNTHWHGDHTGGNENLGKAGVVIVAQDNVRKRMSVEQFLEAFNEKVPASPAIALPIVTFTEGVTFHLNGETIQVFHVPPAHTDGDAVVRFVKADVIHMGDTYFNGMYPFIDASTGGNIDGMIEAANRVLAGCGAATRIVPGHGPLGDKASLTRYREMLVAARDAIRPLVKAGKSRADVVAAKPTKALDGAWGNGFMKPDDFVAVVYDGMVSGSKK